MNTRYPRYIFIPLNEEGERELESGVDPYEYVMDIALSEEEIRILDPIFDLFDEAFDISIGDYEEEEISNENISKAIEIITPYLEKKEEPFAIALRKILHALNVAKENGTYIMFDL